ncbi:helix-turn-helix domain-containing protein [Kaistia dalseonensis]|uniref:AraC-like DNA-binding protein n=1 Tax=Kaistia dalseonensis TaxID=410840 RepID=A0ABU0H3Q9_9HYPH|nr:helix-turn-helix domain-containing protein [Kaistia dalseonensis]MCX5494354.1 helix-turn-helix domain-containing protein [Kaistia dalseonensis]MDQ0436936.1 AraC-like DNA-binding protein [Kaistia dalseonensis]
MIEMAGGWQGLSTDLVPPCERLDYWREATNSLFPPTRLARPSYEGFYGQVSWLRIGEVTLADIVSTSLEVTRSEREIRGQDDRWFEATIQVEGEGAFSQDGRDVVTGPRSMVLYDSRKPYAMRFDGPYRQLSLKVPRAALRERLPNADALVARHVPASGIPGRFIYDLAAGLCDAPEALPEPIASRLEAHLLDLLATALLGADAPAAASPGRLSQLERVKRYILAHLDDPDLDPREIAGANRISLRSLYELFETEDMQVARFIQAQRLDRIRRDLADPLKRALPISTIALDRGFKDISHFSRAFRRQYGMGPRAFRNGRVN